MDGRIRGHLEVADETGFARNSSFLHLAEATRNNFQADIKAGECRVDFSRQQEKSALSINRIISLRHIRIT